MKYTIDFKKLIINQYHNGKTAKQLAGENNIDVQLIYLWNRNSQFSQYNYKEYMICEGIKKMKKNE